jgi:hypothetical protein
MFGDVRFTITSMLKMDGLTNQTVSIQAYFKLKKTAGDIR